MPGFISTSIPAACTPGRRDEHARVLAAVRWTALTGLLVASGCMVGPDYTRPEAPLNQEWLDAQTPSADGASVNLRWWETFNDPTLTKLVESAYQQNLGLRVAGLRVIQARAQRGIAVGQFFPQLQEAFGGVGSNQLSANDAPNNQERSFYDASLGLQAAWELDFWGRFRRGIEAADAEVMLTVADYDAVLVTLASDVATQYIFIRSLQERLEYARANVQLQAETLDLTTTRFRAGAVSELDVTTARSTLANTRALIPELENGLRQSKLVLCVLLGRTPSELDAELAQADSAPLVPEAPPEIVLGIPADLLRRRPDVRAAERFAAAQSARIGIATADLYPQISIVGSTGFVSSTYEGERNSDLGDIFDDDSFAGFIGLQLNWPVFNYGRIESNILAQHALYEQAVAAYQESVIRAASDVEGGLSEFLRAREQSVHLIESVDASQRSTELSLIQYRAGAVDFIRVNDAQTVLVEQQDRLVTSRAAIALGAVRTYRALGGGWEVRDGQEFIDPETEQRLRNSADWSEILGPDWSEGSDYGFPRPALESAEPPDQGSGN